MQKWAKMYIATILALGTFAGAMAVEVPTAEWERMKQQINDLQSRGASVPVTTSMVDTAMDARYGPDQAVTTKCGKLQVGGLLQVWYYSIQQERHGFFEDPVVNGIVDRNDTLSANGFRVRRAELRFNMDLNENISAYIMIDPSREAAGFPHFPSNLGNTKKGTNISPEFFNENFGTGLPVGVDTATVLNTRNINAAQNGAYESGAPKLLQDAYINYHGCIPHHDFQIGQFKPWVGEEGIRNSGELDFVERSMVGFQSDSRDVGASIHGSWWCDRFQYWAGVFNGAGSYYEPGNQHNRPDSNDHKDYNARMLIRPLWDDCWGNLELGGSVMFGRKGDTHNQSPLSLPSPGLNRPINWAVRYNAWASYKFGEFASGLWMRGEWTWIKDRESAGSVIDVLGGSAGPDGFNQEGQAYSRQGIYGALGYRFRDAKWCPPGWLKGFEIAGRYDMFQNIVTADLVRPDKTDRFYTKVVTAGLNYYISGHNAKIQANYNIVNLPNESSSPARVFHTVRNDSFVINFQVMF